MVAEGSGGANWSSLPPRSAAFCQRSAEICRSYATKIAFIAVGEGDGCPISAADFHFYVAIKAVGIGDREGTFGSVDFDAREVGAEDVEGHDHGADGTGGELECGGDVGGGLDGDEGAVLFFAGDGAGGM